MQFQNIQVAAFVKGSHVDFVNGFTENYGDPLGMKASWESLVNFKDVEATKRTETISANAQWFEDHSPVDKKFKKEEVKGVSAKVITAAILAGDLYPATAIGINLPNANWIRTQHGSKSVTIGNLTDAYNKAAHAVSPVMSRICRNIDAFGFNIWVSPLFTHRQPILERKDAQY